MASTPLNVVTVSNPIPPPQNSKSAALSPSKIGGSIAGLMTSIALRRLGHNIRILERSPTALLHDQGAGIVAGGETPSFMSAYDRTDTPHRVTSYQRLYLLDKTGEHIQRENTQQRMTSWDAVYHICRANFDRYESEYVKGRLEDLPGEGTAVYQFGCEVTSVEEDGQGVSVAYKSTLPGDGDKETQHIKADFVIIADGSNSNIRRTLCPQSPEREYAGYVAFRGTVPESNLSPPTREIFLEKFPFFSAPHLQILGYTIPGRNGSLHPGHRLINWVWYVNLDAGSDAYKKTMTDTTGRTHRWTLPAGGHMRDDVWDARKKEAAESLPPQFAEVVEKTEHPFVQAITDLAPPPDGKCWLLGGQGVLVGDALAGFRPHTAASTAQAAMHAVLLGRVFRGEVEREEYEAVVVRYAVQTQRAGVMMGNRSQFG